ncbi:MAG: T9SS C-terminal target domain-containing protein [Bacteroidetes bacterium]|nr:MAG: T9SS C-terminal target domain-containing protein [Bacteroidota bacterium]
MSRTTICLVFLILHFHLVPESVAVYKPVHTGFRPVIDLNAVSSEAIEPGRMRIQFTEQSGKFLDENPVKFFDEPIVFGLSAVDIALKEAGVASVKPTFAGAALKSEFSERHRLWGLHLWYDVMLESETDVIAAVKIFQQLEEVEIAEPVFRKQIVSGHVFDWNAESFFTREDLEEWAPNDPQFAQQWHYLNTGQTGGIPGSDIDLIQAWGTEKGDTTVIVAIIDDGIQFDHPDLAANMWEGTGFNFVDNNSVVVPGDHGTHVAGTVAAVSNNEIGIAGIAGGSGSGDGVRLMSAQVFKGNASGGFPTAFIWAADNGAAISQNSWGYTTAGVFEQAVLNAIDYFNVNGGGDVLDGGITIFAAGNSNAAGAWYPGYYEGAMAVASTNHNDQKAWYSNFGSWVDISAPGGETNNVNNQGVLSTVTNSGYAFYQGTSMACPHVSGVAALVLSHAPGMFSNTELIDILISSADFHYQVNPGFIGQLGTGRLNAHRALLEANNYLLGLINPSDFQSFALSTEEIELSWALNVNQDDVLLAFSSDGFFGIPQGSYAPGDTLPGGGTILYNGSATSFIHEGLEPSSSFFYKIWSIGDSLYSSGRLISGSTLCGVFELPFNVEFVSGQIPDCWEIVDVAGSGRVWQTGSFNNGLNIEGEYAYSGNNLGGEKNTNLITPVLDFSNAHNVNVSFRHFFRTTFLGGAAGTFSYSVDNGSNWTTVNSWTSGTANPELFDADLSVLDGEPMVRFRWNSTINFLGYYWLVGDINISGNIITDKPEIAFDAEEVIVEIQAGDSYTRTVTVFNLGTEDLNIILIDLIYPDNEPEFATFSLEDTLIAPGDSTILNLFFDTSNLMDGVYSATILVESNDPVNAIAEVALSMTVLPGNPPEAMFTSAGSAIIPGENVQFFDLSQGEITMWEWQFPGGEPASSAEQNPLIAYHEPGLYDVTLKVSNVWGDDELYQQEYILVEEPTAVANHQEADVFRVGPNPGAGLFNVVLPWQNHTELRVTGVSGQLLVTKKTHNNSTISLDLSFLSSGAYILEMLDGKDIIDVKTIIIR